MQVLCFTLQSVCGPVTSEPVSSLSLPDSPRPFWLCGTRLASVQHKALSSEWQWVLCIMRVLLLLSTGWGNISTQVTLYAFACELIGQSIVHSECTVPLLSNQKTHLKPHLYVKHKLLAILWASKHFTHVELTATTFWYWAMKKVKHYKGEIALNDKWFSLSS